MTDPKTSIAVAEINLDALQREAEKLVGLLKDRQVGLMTWWGFLRERLLNLQRLSGPIDDARLMRLVCAINREAILSEGQLAEIMKCSRIEVRRLWQDAPNRKADQ